MGWTNYETWCAACWILEKKDNRQRWRAAAKGYAGAFSSDSIKADERQKALQGATLSLGKKLREEVTGAGRRLLDEVCPCVTRSAIGKIDWTNIAAKLLEEFLPGPPPAPVNEAEYVCEWRFPMGNVVATPGALESLHAFEISTSLTRHVRGDWGLVDLHDAQENEFALKNGLRLRSAYENSDGNRFWIVTEADRSSTTVLLPEEY